MQLIKQIVMKDYQKYIENNLNNRFFPFEIGQAISLAMVVLEEDKGAEFDDTLIKDVNKLYKQYHTLPFEKTRHIMDEELREKEYHRLKSNIAFSLKEKIDQLMRVIYEFFKKYKEVEVVEKDERKFEGKGVVAVIYPHHTYEVH